MTSPGNHEIAPAELANLLRGDLPSTLPLEGWRTTTLHCQVDALGPSDRHPDLVKLEVSFPPVKPSKCARCHGNKVVPDFTRWNRHHGEPEPIPCPECSACNATMLHALHGRVQCGLAARHCDVDRMPVFADGVDDPGGWHQSAKRGDEPRFVWSDRADGATPHDTPITPAVPRPLQRVGITCLTCGPTTLEEYPSQAGVLRCGNCKEHLARGYLEGE